MSGSGQGAKEGTAFFINKQGNLITHAGFAEQCNNMQMWFEGRQYPLNVVMSDPAMEVAVLSSSVVPRITAVFKNDGDAVNGESTLAVGYNNDGTSMSRSPTILQGSVESAQGVNGDMNYLQLSLPSKMGNEGAPVVSSSGHTVGMLVGQGTAVRGDSIKQYLSRSGVNYRFHSGAGRRFDTNRLANHARSYTVKVFCR